MCVCVKKQSDCKEKYVRINVVSCWGEFVDSEEYPEVGRSRGGGV